MHEFGQARKAIEAMIRSDNLEGLLNHAQALHGHLCPMVTLGVKAGHQAMKYLEDPNTGMEEIVAVVECNNCFTDGIQAVTGCTFGNNALIFKDLGKTAVTVIRRRDGRALRLVVRPDYREHLFDKYPAAGPLFDKVVVKRQSTPEEEHRFQHVWEAMARRELRAPLESQMTMTPLTCEAPEYARIFATVVCHRCGEGVMAPRSVEVDGRPTCLTCAGRPVNMLTGQGIICGG